MVLGEPLAWCSVTLEQGNDPPTLSSPNHSPAIWGMPDPREVPAQLLPLLPFPHSPGDLRRELLLSLLTAPGGDAATDQIISPNESSSSTSLQIIGEAGLSADCSLPTFPSTSCHAVTCARALWRHRATVPPQAML